MSNDKLQSFSEFWPFYVGEHRLPSNRLLHYVGTLAGLSLWVTALVKLNPWLALAAALMGYGLAWVGHFVIERNRPATFTYPLWSFFGDLKMLSFALTGRMGAEVTRLYSSRRPTRDAPLLSEARAR